MFRKNYLVTALILILVLECILTHSAKFVFANSNLKVATESQFEVTNEDDDQNEYEKEDEIKNADAINEKKIIEDQTKHATQSEVENGYQESVVASESETEYIETIKLASDSEISYGDLNAYNQLLSCGAKVSLEYDNIIVLEEDIKLDKAVYFSGDFDLDLAGHSIIGPDDDSALYIENKFTLFNSSSDIGAIKGMANNHPTISVKNAEVEFVYGSVYGSDGVVESIDGGDAIHLINSDILLSGAFIYGGNGYSLYDGKGGDGGDGIVIKKVTKDNLINLERGQVSGGNGGNGIGSETPGSGAALIVDGLTYESEFFGEGLKGNIGGGYGGNGLVIESDKFNLKNLICEPKILNAGHCGFSSSKAINKSQIEENLFSTKFIDNENLKNSINHFNDLYATNSDVAYYSLYDIDGKNYVTSLKNQGTTELSGSFAAVAYAETALIRNYSDYVKNVLGKDIEKTYNRESDTEELDLSELYFAMQMSTQSKDEYGNAGLSSRISNVDEESNWSDTDINSNIILMGSTTWRSFVEENPKGIVDENLDWSNGVPDKASRVIDREFLNKYNNSTVVHTKSAYVHGFEDFWDATNNSLNKESLIKKLKEDIVNYSGVILNVYTGGRREEAILSNGSSDYSKNGISYGKVKVLDMPRVASGSDALKRHMIYCIGFDDDIEFSTSIGSYKGAFICKDSWECFTLVPYDNNFVFYYGDDAVEGVYRTPNVYMDYLIMDFLPAYTKYENLYFYDSGLGRQYIPKQSTQNTIAKYFKSIFSTYKIRNNKEQIKAVSFYASEKGSYEISLYKVSALNNVSKFEAEMIDSKRLKYMDVEAIEGFNTFDIGEVDLNKDDIVAVKIKRTDADSFGNIYIDTSYLTSDGKTRYTTDAKGQSFATDRTVNTHKFIVLNGNGNARIRLITNNYVTLYSNNNKAYFNGKSNVAYIMPKLRSTFSEIIKPQTSDNNLVFLKYNTKSDGSGMDWKADSVYLMDISKSLSLYAQYTDDNKNADTGSSRSVSTSGGSSYGFSVGKPSVMIKGYDPIESKNIDVPMREIPIAYVNDIYWLEKDDNNDYHIYYKDSSGEYKTAINSFVCISRVVQDKEGKEFEVLDFYYFDDKGKRYEGWLKDSTGMIFYFENEENMDVARLARGWTLINGEYYYFDGDGNLLKDQITPDGYKVNINGIWKDESKKD